MTPSAITADARPTKRFFIDNLTRDLTLEDAILDLVDNSVDSLIRVNELDVSPNLLRQATNGKTPAGHPLVEITINQSRIEILDRCGGIPLERARSHVFRFGRVEDGKSTLGVYGIGLKRAVFKMGKQITIESRTTHDGFSLNFSVDEWAADDDDWDLPLTTVTPAKKALDAGTRIVVTDLTPEAALRIGDGTLLGRLQEALGTTYSLFLDHFLSISLNGKRIQARHLPIGLSSTVAPAVRTISLNGVTVELVAGLAARKSGEWNAEQAGWYVLCNGRVVVAADKTELTGWGSIFGPTFVSKYRGFVGIAFFFSTDPTALPWTTTKRGLNQESRVYLLVRKEMSGLAKPVLTFLNRMYPSEPAEGIHERRVADQLKLAAVLDVVKKGDIAFTSPPSRSRKRDMINVQYKAALADVDRIRKKLNKTKLGAGEIGRMTFEYYLKLEFPE